MSSPAKSLTTPAALLLAAALCFVGGCENDTKSDAEMQAKMRQAIALREVHAAQGDADAGKALEAAAKEAAGSPGTRAQLDSMRAQLHLDMAHELLRRIDNHELLLSRVAFELARLAMQLDAGTMMASDYSKYDPRPVREKIAQQITAAQGGPDKPTWQYESMQMPTLAAVKQHISELEGQIAQLQEKAKQLGDQRDAALKDAQAQQEASDAAKGRQSVDLFAKASDLRRKAGELSIQIDQLNAQMVPIQRELSIAQGQLEVLNDIVKQLQAQQASLDAAWQSIQQQIAAQGTLAKQIVGNEGAATGAGTLSGATISEKAAEIARLAGELTTLRQQAKSELEDAVELFKKAHDSAETLRVDLGQRISTSEGKPAVKIWQAASEIINPQYYRLREAAARRMLGSLYASEAASIANRVNLGASVAPIIERAGAAAPAELRPGNLAKDQENAIRLADEGYGQAKEQLENIAQGTAQELQNAGRIEQIITLYDWAQLKRLAGQEGEAKKLMDQAISIRNEAAERKVALPALPAEFPPVPGAPAPSTAPTAPAQPGSPTTASPDEQAITALQLAMASAVAKGDIEAFKAVVEVEPGQEADFQKFVNFVSEISRFRDALTAKLPQASGQLLGSMEAAFAKGANEKVTVQGETATVQEGGKAKKQYVKVDGQWKAFFGAPEDDADRAKRAQIDQMAAAFQQATNGLETGTITTPEQVSAAMMQASGSPAPGAAAAPGAAPAPATQP